MKLFNIMNCIMIRREKGDSYEQKNFNYFNCTITSNDRGTIFNKF